MKIQKKKWLIVILLAFSLFMTSCLKLDAKTSINAKYYCVYEANTNRIIDEKNMNTPHLTASICKILTCITAIEYGDLNKWVDVSVDATKQEGSSIYLQVKDKIKLIDLLYGLMLRSGNDCAYLIACNVFGYDKFIELMNEVAKKVGMTNSTFTNPSGLDDETSNYSTCLDMARLISYCSLNELFCKINSAKSYNAKTYNGNILTFINKHMLIINNDEGLMLGKTGYTKKAKRTLVTLKEQKGLKVVVVTFEGNNDFNDHKRVINDALDRYYNKTIIKSQIIDTSSTYPYISYIKDDISICLKEDETKKLEIKIKLYEKALDDVCGTIEVYLDEKIIYHDYVYRYY